MMVDISRSALNAEQRQHHLDAMTKEVFDLIVIGGGITGAGVALDAATRGLRVGLIEQRDYASGTSSRSSKMLHGGLRYLEQFEIGLVREALRERNLMLNALCPHLVTPASFVYPLQRGVLERLYVGGGVMFYEILARLANSPLPWHSHLGAKGMASLAPALLAKGGVRYWDAVVDDARHTLTVIRTAAAHGAFMANSVRVAGLDLEGGRVGTVSAVDVETGRPLPIRTRTVISASGIWTEDIEEMAGDPRINLEPSKGIHLVIPRGRIDSQTGIIFRTNVSVLIVVPWGDHWIVGTTDTPWGLNHAHPAASRSDIDYLLTWLNSVLRDAIRAEDIVGVYAGLRPLLQAESNQTSKLSREHAVVDHGTALISVAGGKYTTYRVMAADAVDAAFAYLDRPRLPAVTASVPLVGAMPYSDDRLIGRYGSLSDELKMGGGGDRQVVADAPYIRAELEYAVTHEGALHLDDVLTRRTRLSIETRDRGVAVAPRAAEIMAGVRGWNRLTVDREIAHYEARVAAELDSQSQLDDHTADAARTGAPDVRSGLAG